MDYEEEPPINADRVGLFAMIRLFTFGGDFQ